MWKKRYFYLAIFTLSVLFFLNYTGLSLVRKLFEDITGRVRENQPVAAKSFTNDLAVDEVINGKGMLTVLFIGIDTGEFPGGGYREGRGRSDSLILVQLNERTRELNLLSIPRDTLVTIEGYGSDKINHAYAYGGEKLAVETVEAFSQIPIDRYVVLDYKAFEAIVDCLGGVEVEVDKEFESMHIQFKPGLRQLNGQEAYAFIRFRKEALGDIARVERQQRFIKALLSKVNEQKSLTKLVEIFFQFQKKGKTDLSFWEMIKLADKYGGKLDQLKLNAYTVPGSFYDYGGVSYWKPKQDELTEIVNKHFVPVGVDKE